MRPTSFLGLLGLIVVGVIIADFVANPEGTKVIGKAIVDVQKPSLQALLGKPPT